jgi:hypothetical protein
MVELLLPAIVGGLELGELVRENGFALLPQAIASAFTNTDVARVLWRAALVVYFLSWVIGADSDIEFQQEAYLVAPREETGGLTRTDIAMAVGIAIGFGVLCYVRNSYRGFALALTGFWIGNFLGWRYLTRMLEPPIRESIARCERGNRYIELEKVRIVEQYILGRWQWWRFGAGAVLAVGMNILAWKELSLGYAAFSIFAFVAIVESWIWLMRSRGKYGLRLLEDLSDRYGEKLATVAVTPSALRHLKRQLRHN